MFLFSLCFFSNRDKLILGHFDKKPHLVKEEWPGLCSTLPNLALLNLGASLLWRRTAAQKRNKRPKAFFFFFTLESCWGYSEMIQFWLLCSLHFDFLWSMMLWCYYYFFFFCPCLFWCHSKRATLHQKQYSLKAICFFGLFLGDSTLYNSNLHHNNRTGKKKNSLL